MFRIRNSDLLGLYVPKGLGGLDSAPPSYFDDETELRQISY